MPEAFSSEASLLLIERPRCPKCQGRMMLARIERRSVHSDLRTFECPKCEKVRKTLAEHPTNSDEPGWRNSGLKAPE
jgi:hypothetical protein